VLGQGPEQKYTHDIWLMLYRCNGSNFANLLRMGRKHKAWYKIIKVWDRFINDYLVTYRYKATIGNESAITAGSEDVFADNEVITADREEDSAITYYQSNLKLEDFSELVPVCIETRPLKFSPLAYKKLNRLLVEGYVLNDEEYPLSVNLFGSPDNKN
jgi:hypothetical protein